MAASLPTRCANCGSGDMYTRRIPTSLEMPILRGLGEFLEYGQLDVVLCADCGHCSLFAAPEARRRVRNARGWRRCDGVTPRCTQCGYDLRATPHRCPECGLVPTSTGAP